MRACPARCSAIAAAVGLGLVLTACSGQERATSPGATCDGQLEGPAPSYVTAWFHTGTPAEQRALAQQVAAFNTAQQQVQVEVTNIPPTEYASQVRSAADTGNLPDLLDLEGPYLANHAFSGQLVPLDSCVPSGLRADLLPSIVRQGSYAGRLWGMATRESGLGLYVRPSVLHRIGARILRGVADAWTASEFTRILHRLRQAGYQQPLDLQMNATSGPNANPEWLTYGFAPVVWSAGGDLINRSTYRTVQGVLNAPGPVRALGIVQDWFRAGLVSPNTSGTAFVRGQVPISWVGHWMLGAYREAFPRDLKIVPLPRFGSRPSSALGSWQWGITASAMDGDAAWHFLSYLRRPAQVRQMSHASGAIPATRSAIRGTPDFAPGGREHLYIQQLDQGVARARPPTPAYPEITAAFSAAILKIARGHRVQPALDTAARRIDRSLAAHHYFHALEP
jgi:multiple sugar transport system substrate-binding protein